MADRIRTVTDRIRTVTGTINCSRCGLPSWNAVLNPGEPCLGCKKALRNAARTSALDGPDTEEQR